MIFILFVISLFSLIMTCFKTEKIAISLGETIKQDIRANRDIVDEIETERLKKVAVSRVEPRDKRDMSVQVKINESIIDFFKTLDEIRKNDLELKDKIWNFKNQQNLEFSDTDIQALIMANEEEIEKLQNSVTNILNQIMSSGLKVEEIENEKKNISLIFKSLEEVNGKFAKIGEIVVSNLIEPNSFLDIETTNQKREEAANSVEPVVIKKGEIIARKGYIADERIMKLVEETGLLIDKNKTDYWMVFGAFVMSLLMVLILFGYIHFLEKKMKKRPQKVMMLCILSIITIGLSISSYGISKYVMPIISSAMIVAILLDAKLAILINVFVTVVVSYITKLDVNTTMIYILGGITAAIMLVKTNHRYNIFVSGIISSIVMALFVMSFDFMEGANFTLTFNKMLYLILNGLSCSILTFGSTPVWEASFKILTPVKLLELSNPNNPLLKRLLMEAPGTYHHSMVVGNLSEAATEAVNGNSLLARVGAYYHDIGKLKRPYFFKENQFDIENPHNEMTPRMSALVITNHVKDGLEIAKEYKLPSKIQEIIVQHHGDTLVAYFYHRAMSESDGEEVLEEDFRYKGPSPMSKEAAIVMMADSVEAAVRSIKNPTKEKIENLVSNIIKGKMEDGQLNQCDITFKDMERIKNAFMNILLGIFHERIEYPDMDDLKRSV